MATQILPQNSDINQPITLKLDGSAITVNAADTVEAVLVDHGEARSSKITVDVATPATGSDLANGVVVIEITAAESDTWKVGREYHWEVRRVDNATGDALSYYTDDVFEVKKSLI